MIYWPFDSVVGDDGEGNPTYDREFNSENLRKIFGGLYTNGVAMSDNSGALQVSPGSGMNVVVGSGFVIIEGAMGCQETPHTVVIDAADNAYTRIDSIVARLNTNISGRCISIEYLKGTAGAAPTVPEIVRSGGIYDLRLATIRIPAAATAITAVMITDTRMGSECGLATARPQEIDTATIFDQYQAALAEYMQYVQECIDDTVAGQLQTQIDNMNDPDVVNSLANQLSDINTTLSNINASLATQNRLLTALTTAYNVRTTGSGFRFNNNNWVVDTVYCVGKIVILKGHLTAPWNTGDSAKWSAQGSYPVYLTCPSGYRPIHVAELNFGAKTSNNLSDKTCFELWSTIASTASDGSTSHLVYGYAQSLRSTHTYSFQIVYFRNGSV